METIKQQVSGWAGGQVGRWAGMQVGEGAKKAHLLTRSPAHLPTCIPAFIMTLSFMATLLFASPVAAQEPSKNPSPGNGSLLWAENCAPCHGVTGRGDGPTAAAMEFTPTDFTDPEAAKTREPAQMFIDVKEGRMEKLMPPWGERLSDEQIWDAVAYVRSLSIQPNDLTAGKSVYAENCAECHGDEGVSDEIDLSHPGLLVGKSQQMLFDDLRADQDDHASLADLSDDELWQSLTVVRTLSLDMPSYEGVLRGQVINGATDQAAANIDLILYVLSQNSVMQTITGVSDEEGNFIFENLDTDHSVQYGLEGLYNDISYFSEEPIIFTPENIEAEATLKVYDTTADPGAVSVGTLHRIIEFIPGWMHVADVYGFSNSGDKTYIGQAGADHLPETVKIAIPDDAENVSFHSEGARAGGDGNYVDSQPIVPGENVYELVVTYDIPFEGSKLRLETPALYKIETVNALVSDQGETVSSPQLKLVETSEIQGRSFLMMSGSDLQAGQPLVMEFDKLDKIEMPPAAGDSPHGSDSLAQVNAQNIPEGPDQNLLMWGVLGLGVLAIGFGIVYALQRRPQGATASRAVLEQEKTRLLTLLSELESLHQAGEIDDQAYQRLKHKNRTLLKQVLIQLET